MTFARSSALYGMDQIISYDVNAAADNGLISTGQIQKFENSYPMNLGGFFTIQTFDLC